MSNCKGRLRAQLRTVAQGAIEARAEQAAIGELAEGSATPAERRHDRADTWLRIIAAIGELGEPPTDARH